MSDPLLRPYRPNLGRWPVPLPALALATLAVLTLAVGAARLGGLRALGGSFSPDSHERAARAEALMIRAEAYLRAAKGAAGVPRDPGLTAGDSAFLGDELTPLVTTLGSLEAKRLAADPQWARVLTLRLSQAGVGPGDVVAASFSGSFPGLNFAVMAACAGLEARLVAVSSVTASTWGANQPGFTWPEIEALLVRSGLIRPASVAITPGGDGDRAADLEPEARAQAIEIQQAAARALGAEAISPADVSESTAMRMQRYRRSSLPRGPVLFVNVGGSAASLGASLAILRQRSGFLRAMPFDLSGDRGLVARFAEQGVPVLNLLNIRDLAFRWGLL